MESPALNPLHLDEEALRKAVLKGYFGARVAPLEPTPFMAHLRQLLSGPPGGVCDPMTYYFELEPAISVPVFLRGLESEAAGLARLIAEPILQSGEECAAGKRSEVAGNLSMYVTGLAGSIAVKCEVAEAEAGALLAGFLLVLSRIGPQRARELYQQAFAGPSAPHARPSGFPGPGQGSAP